MNCRNFTAFAVVLVTQLIQVSKCEKVAKKSPLQCYTCNNDISFEDCTYYQSNNTCQHHEDRCIKAMWDLATVGSITTGYIKGCTTKDKCTTSAFDICKKNDGYVKCEVMCCEGNLCNGSGRITSGMMTSVMLLIALVLIWNIYEPIKC